MKQSTWQQVKNFYDTMTNAKLYCADMTSHFFVVVELGPIQLSCEIEKSGPYNRDFVDNYSGRIEV